MGVMRGEVPADNFTIISNDWLRDARLSWKAKGLLSYIASHRAGYALSVEQIVAEGEDGRDAVRAGLRELEDAGYLTREKRRGDGGKIVSTDYRIGNPVAGKPASGDDQPEQDVSAGQTSDGLPADGKPASKKTTSEKTTEDQPSSRAARKRAVALPEDFEVTEAMRAWYAEKIGAAVNGLAEHEKFLDYYRANGRTHKDWPAAWRYWMRNALERSPRGRSPLPPRPGTYTSAAERNAAALDREAEVARVAEAIVESRGGNPESFTEVSPVMAKLKADPTLLEALLPVLAVPVAQQADLLRRLLHGLQERGDHNGSASRTSDMYSDGDGYIEGQVADAPREVTDHASE